MAAPGLPLKPQLFLFGYGTAGQLDSEMFLEHLGPCQDPSSCEKL